MKYCDIRNMSLATITIDGRRIGPGHPVYVIAEMSANHHGDFERAARLVQAAKDAGADAIKLQTYTPETMTLRSDEAAFRVGGGTLWDGRTLYDLYQEAAMPWEWQPKLQAIARALNLTLFSSAFDASSIEFLERMRVPAHKIASFELVDHALIRRAAGTGKPLILSTGMATEEEIREAIHVAREAGAAEIAILKCTSAYPAKPHQMHLRAIPHAATTFGVPVGLSDHTLGITVPIAAVALGACLVEKHLTLSREVASPDSAFSSTPEEFAAMVAAIRDAEQALGEARFGGIDEEQRHRVFRRSLFAVERVNAGDLFTAANVRAIRPGLGLPPKWLPNVLGRRAAADIRAGTPLAWSLVEGPPG